MSNEDSNKIVKQLREVGLKQNEAEIYLFLLQNGVSTPPQIAKGTAIARTNCYNILKSLEEKDVIELIQKGKREAFLARDPHPSPLEISKCYSSWSEQSRCLWQSEGESKLRFARETSKSPPHFA
jgi:sugar-specific transcriptional regulator TrmB